MSDGQDRHLDSCLEERGVHIEDSNHICWNTDSKQHPRNWSSFPKYYTTIVVVWLEFFMTAISSAGTAAAESASKEYEISKTLAYFAFITIYLIGQTIGSIFCAPVSEICGRRTVYIIAISSFGAFSAITAAVPHVAGVYVGRFFQGVAAAIPATVAFGNFSDLFDAQTRIWVVYAYTLWGMAGLALGPIYSTYVTLKLGWRAVFYLSATASGISLVFCAFIKESNASQLLEKRTHQVRKITAREDLVTAGAEDKSNSPVKDFFQDHLYRPVFFLFTEPLVMLCAILCAIAFGLIYGLAESLTIVYTTPPFDTTFSKTSSCLSFLAILMGEILNVIPRFFDHYLFRRFRKQHRRVEPETKIRSFAIACPALAIGLWIFGWTVPTHVQTVPWPVSMFGLICIGFAANDFSYVLFGYITDSYGDNAASAVSAISIARTITAGIVPLFMTQMYEGLGNNYATTLLAGLATLFCFTPFLFLRNGHQLRKKSKWAAKGDDALTEENKHMREGDHAGREMREEQPATESAKEIRVVRTIHIRVA